MCHLARCQGRYGNLSCIWRYRDSVHRIFIIYIYIESDLILFGWIFLIRIVWNLASIVSTGSFLSPICWRYTLCILWGAVFCYKVTKIRKIFHRSETGISNISFSRYIAASVMIIWFQNFQICFICTRRWRGRTAAICKLYLIYWNSL